jgi:hypothetical protein
MIAEGVMRGHQAFGALAVVSAVASAAMVFTLGQCGGTLIGVWTAFTVFTAIRTVGALTHHLFIGPLSGRALGAKVNSTDLDSRLVDEVEAPPTKTVG